MVAAVAAELAALLFVFGWVLVRDVQGLRARYVQHLVRLAFPRADSQSPWRWLGIEDRDAYVRVVNRNVFFFGCVLLFFAAVAALGAVATAFE